MYYTNSKWKKIKNGYNKDRNKFKIYFIILTILAIIIALTIFNSKWISVKLSNFEAESISNIEESESAPEITSPTIIDNFKNYLLKVNKATNVITVYTIDNNGDIKDVEKTFRCSVNPNIESNEYKIYEKNIWRNLNEYGFGQYTCRIASNCYIHSVPYYSQNNNSLNVNAYNNLGNSAQIGYIYLASGDAKWIYENCGMDTVVEIYEDLNEEPAIELGEKSILNSSTVYDPTDNSVNIKICPTKINYMTGIKDASIKVGTLYNIWEGVKAVDTSGNDITEYISVTGSVNNQTPGTYTLIYHLNDNFGTNLAYYSYVTVY